jgi:hypothetical protein
MNPWSDTLISSRRKLFSDLNQNYEALDDSYFNVYTTIRNYALSTYAPFKPLAADLKVAYENLAIENSTNEIATNFTRFFLRHSQYVDSISQFAANSMLMMYSPMMGQDVTPPTQSIKMSISSAYSSMLMHVTMRFIPTTSTYESASDECINKIFTAFTSIYKPYVRELLDGAKNAVTVFPSLTTNVTSAIDNSLADLRGLLNQIRYCGNASEKLTCIHEIVS